VGWKSKTLEWWYRWGDRGSIAKERNFSAIPGCGIYGAGHGRWTRGECSCICIPSEAEGCQTTGLWPLQTVTYVVFDSLRGPASRRAAQA